MDDRLETPGNPDGLLSIADGCAGHACIMPMRRVGGDWEPTDPGWGLLDARTRKLIDPPALISGEKIVMTDWELQDLAVQVVRDELAKEGRELMSWNGNPGVMRIHCGWRCWHHYQELKNPSPHQICQPKV